MRSKPIAKQERKTALCYVRQSVTRNGQDMTSPERQKDALQAECNQRGWQAEFYIDAEGHRSGRTEETRPEWLKLKQRLKDPDIAALVAWDMSRLHRNVASSLQTIDAAKDCGVEIVFVADYQRNFRVNEDNATVMIIFQALKDQMEATQTGQNAGAPAVWY